MVKVLGGKLRSCRNHWEPPSKCDDEVVVDAVFLDKHEVTVTDYANCVDAGKCSTKGLTHHYACNWRHRKKRQTHPINCVSYPQAKDYCAWKARRLPTGPEWEYAARAPDGRLYAWGNDVVALTAALEAGPCWRDHSTCPVGSDTKLVHPFGLNDMAGNVSEWTNENPVEDPRLRRGISEPVRAVGWRVAYGTNWLDPDLDESRMLLLSKIEVRRMAGGGSPSLGLRCAK